MRVYLSCRFRLLLNQEGPVVSDIDPVSFALRPYNHRQAALRPYGTETLFIFSCLGYHFGNDLSSQIIMDVFSKSFDNLTTDCPENNI